MSRPHSLEELIWHMRSIARFGPDGWGRDFAKSICRQSARRGWRPSEKQDGIMRRLVAERLTTPDDDLVVIE